MERGLKSDRGQRSEVRGKREREGRSEVGGQRTDDATVKYIAPLLNTLRQVKWAMPFLNALCCDSVNLTCQAVTASIAPQYDSAYLRGRRGEHELKANL